jgi:peptidoglycan/LPS O-acetylase OafA/YrhL
MAWLPKIPIGSEKYPALTGVRAAGAVAVFFDHFPLWPGSHVVINVLAFFYALSGFLIVRVYYERAELTRAWLSKYFVNRFARIYPVYFLLLTLAVCLQHNFGPWTLFANYTLLHALFHGTSILIQPSWSLTVEETFYFLAPVFMLLARRYNFAAAFGLGWLLLLLALGISRTDVAFLHTPVFVLSTTFFGHFVEFFAGVYLALAVIRLEKAGAVASGDARYTLSGVVSVAVLLACMLYVYQHPASTHFALAVVALNNFLIPVPIALLYWGLLRENTCLSRLLSTDAAGLLGRASYSFYLLHMFAIDYVGIPLVSRLGGYRLAVVLLTLIGTWAAAVLLFVCYEEPLNVSIRKRFRSQEKSVGMAATLFRVKS